MNPPDFDDELEREHFNSIVETFKYYRTYCMQRLIKTQRFINNLPESHQRRLARYKEYLSKFKACFDANDHILSLIIKDVETLFQNNTDFTRPINNGIHNGVHDSHKNGNINKDVDLFITGIDDEDNNMQFVSSSLQQRVNNGDVEKVQTVLKQLVRDWGVDGAKEREQCYNPILDELKEQFPEDKTDVSEVRVLVPGAGLGRLAWEIAALGYSCQGNEFSAFMLFASNFMLNKCTQDYVVYPWVHQYVNNLSCDHQVAPSHIPDIRPASIQIGEGARHIDITMTAGDFLTVYTEADDWDCVATCFFIDCAPNVIDFIETIFKILKPGGVWINLGPLLYHYSDVPNENSIEPPYDILCEIIRDVGFIFEKSKTGVKTKYAQNPHSMLQHEYDSVFFVCRKPDVVTDGEDKVSGSAS